MAVTFDNAVAGDPEPNQSIIGWEHPVGAGENRYMLVAVGANGDAGSGSNPPNGTVPPEVDGVACEFIRGATGPEPSLHRVEVWGAAIPGSSAAAIPVMFMRGAAMQFPVGASMSFFGVDPASPIIAHDGDSGDGGPLTLTRTLSAAADALIADYIVFNDLTARELVPAAGQTQRVSDSHGYNNHLAPWLKGSTKPGGTSVTTSWANASGFQLGAIIAVALRAAGGGGGPGPGDTTAPTLTSPAASQTGPTTASGSVSTNEANGTLFAVVLPSATATPSASSIIAGTGVAARSQAVSSTGVQIISGGFTGLTAETSYRVHFAHRDAANNVSNVVSSAAFTTASSGTPPVLGITGVAANSSGSAISGATVRLFNQTTGVYIGSTTTNSSGVYSFTGLTAGNLYHAAIEYSSGGVLYNARSQHSLSPS